MRILRVLVFSALLGALSWASARGAGTLPPLGGLLHPVHGAWGSARAAVPPGSIEGSVPGLEGPVRIVVDDRGVPHVFAEHEMDAYRALGYAAARDRLFQMELQTRAAEGTLTELAGGSALPLDRDARAAGLGWAAERQWNALEDTSRARKAIVAYADGVNAYIASLTPATTPIEYKLTGTRPRPWKPLHTFHFVMRMAQTLAWGTSELRNAEVASLVGREAAASLFPVESPIQEPIQPIANGPRYAFTPIVEPGAPDTLSRALASILGALAPHDVLKARRLTEEVGDVGVGSNNWAVAPARSATQRALLAGDPHLDLTLPSIWYEAHLVVPGALDVYGAGFPASPGVVIGFNRDAAWTYTNTGADVLDVYRETVNDSVAPTRYRLDGSWRPLELRTERFVDRRGGVVAIDTTRFTHRGPMRRVRGAWHSIRWTAHDTANRRIAGSFMATQHASSVSDYLRATQLYVAPAQNMLVADRQGNIGIRSTGKYPIRPGDGRGNVVFDGSTSASDWTGYWAIPEYPQSVNPAQGFLASANQQPVDPATGARYQGDEWYAEYRALHLNRLLRLDAAVTVEKMREMQTDPGSMRADVFAPALVAAGRVAAAAGDRVAGEAAETIAAWDRRYLPADRRTILFETAMDSLQGRLWDELVRPADTAALRRRVATPPLVTLEALLRAPRSAWWDDRRTAVREDRDALLAGALVAAWRACVAQYGAPLSDGWAWGKARPMSVPHLLRLDGFGVRDLAVRSGPSTLAPRNGPSNGASWRMVVELGDEVRARVTYPGGQSGNPASRWYADRIPTWVEGRLDTPLVPRTAAELPPSRVVTTIALSPSRPESR